MLRITALLMLVRIRACSKAHFLYMGGLLISVFVKLESTFNLAKNRYPIFVALARIECEPGGEHSTRSDRVTNIGYLLFHFSSVPLTETTLLLSL